MKGTFFPAVASLSSRNLASRDRSFFFSSTTAGASVGTLLTGTLGKKSLITSRISDRFVFSFYNLLRFFSGFLGSYLNESFGWPSVFYMIGFLALLWTAVLR